MTKYNRFISASFGTQRQLSQIDSITSGHCVPYQDIRINHDYQKLWGETAEEALTDMTLFFDTETMMPAQIYRCMKVLCGMYAYGPVVLKRIKEMIEYRMYGINGQGEITQLSLDMINNTLIPKYFKDKPQARMKCDSLL